MMQGYRGFRAGGSKNAGPFSLLGGTHKEDCNIFGLQLGPALHGNSAYVDKSCQQRDQWSGKIPISNPSPVCTYALSSP